MICRNFWLWRGGLPLIVGLLIVWAPAQATARPSSPARAAQPGVILVDDPPFSLPFASDPGPTTWLYEQHYGNTTSAFNYGNVWYEFG
ncbi:MAG: hypothetical protein HY866_23545, partial [Chloroflexi bacterium]|nr:hypothetical protein [Chloroflexota bacterium]